MEFRDAVKHLRSELGLTQVELATGLNINAITVGRWENGKTLPTRSITAVLLEYARTKGASKNCLDTLTQSISSAAKEKMDFSGEALYAVEHASLRQLIDDAFFPIYVCDMESDELLYLNQKARVMVGSEESAIGKKCYESLMHRDTPCEFCHKQELIEGKFKSHDAYRSFDGITYHVQGRLIEWNGRRAQVRYVLGQDISPVRQPAETKSIGDAFAFDAAGEKDAATGDFVRLAAQHSRIIEVLNETPSGIAVIEVDPRDIPGSLHTTYYNDRFFSFSGYSRDEYDARLKKNQLAFVFDGDIPILLADTEKMCSGEIGVCVDSTVRCHTKSGGFRWLLLTGQLVQRRGDICVINIAMADITEKQEALDRQRISEEMLRIAAETDQRAMIVYDVKNNSCRVESRTLFSAKYGEILENVPQSLVDRGIAALDSISELCALFARIRSGEHKIRVSLQMRTGSSRYEWFECNAATVFDAEGLPDHAVLVFHNITEQRVKEAVYKKWQQAIDTRPPESYTLFRCNLSKDSGIDEQNGSLLKIKFTADVLSFNARTKLYADEYVCPDDRNAYSALLDADTLLAMFYRGERSASLEYRETSENGEEKWRRLTVELVEYLDSMDIQAFLMYEDIDEAKKAEIEAREIAEVDPLTGALNRAAFAEKVDEIILHAPSAHDALLMLDMDGFKQLNDTFGHAAGDQALQEVAAVLRSFIRKGDLVCRFGGDEFFVWLRDIPYDAAIAKAAQQMCEHIRKAYSQEVLLSASIGIAIYPRDGHCFDELYLNADKALYKVKRAKKGSYAFFSVPGEEQTPEIAEALSAVKPAPHSSRGAKRRLLIVDDNESGRMLLKGIFKDEYLIETAKNGAEAMIRLRHFGASISVVLLDLLMPGVDGFTVLKRMQSNADLRTIPVIVVTGDEERSTLLKAIELGAAEYVTKPVDVDLLRMRVQSVISKAENERLRAQNSYLMLQRAEEMKYRTVLESTGTVVVEYDWRNHVFIYDNEISKYIAGNYDHRGLWQVFLSDMVADSADAKSMQDMLLALAGNKEAKQDSKLIKLKTPDKKKHWFRMNLYKSEDAYGLAEKMILTFNDVHEEVLANDKLLFQATRDELTGLYNRAGFLEKAAGLIAAREPGCYVMACIDIEKFKIINDQYGTEKGDEILRKFAQVLASLHRDENGICCRIMADNFAVLYPARLLDSPELAAAHNAIEHLDSTIPSIQFAIGRCLVDDKALNVSAIYDRAVIAKNTVKGRYDTHIAAFDQSMRTAILRQQEITGQMNHALESGQFEVWLQPQFNHASGMLSGAEALVRWRHPVEGLIPPTEFIPIFERNGFVYEVDKYVWEQTCILLRKSLDQGLTPVPVSVNISRYDVFRDDLISIIEGLVKKYALPLDLLRLEITESAFSESADQTIKTVQALVDAGFTVEIDDFGSGYSSLNTLKDVPAQILKMDMRFLENDKNAQRGGSIIESVVRMAKWLGMSVIAEGVETIEQADYLRSIGCNYIQGYLYSRPTQVLEYEKLFADGKTDSQLGKLKAVETWNNSAFWNPTSMETLIFNSYVGGACIFEYHDGKAELLRYNAGYAEIFGGNFKYDHTDAHNNILSVLDETNAALLQSCIASAIATKKEASCEVKLLGSKHEIYLYIRATVRQIAQAGERHLFYCVVFDNTEQRIAERKQLESKRQMEVVMSNIHGGITATIYHGKNDMEIVFSNDGFYEMYGYTKEQFAAEVPNMLDLIFPEDREQTMETVARIARERGSEAYEYRCRKRDGGTIYIQCTNSVISLDGIGDTVLLAVTTDVTALREAQQAKNATMNRLETVMDVMPGGMTAVAFQKDGLKFLFANERYYEMHGIQRGSIGEEHLSNVLDLVVPEDRERMHKLVHRAAKTGRSASAEYRIRRPDGVLRWMRAIITMTKLVDIDAPVQVTAFSDVTDIKNANSQLQFLNDTAHNIMTQPDNERAIKKTLEDMLDYFAGERTYIFEFNYETLTSDNTYEVCAEGTTSEQSRLQGLSFEVQRFWMNAFKNVGFVAIPSIAKMDDSEADMRELLLSQNIHSLIVAPLWREQTLIGYMGIDNPANAVEQIDRLQALADYIAVLLTRRDLMRKISHDTDAIQTLINDTPGGFLRMEIHPGGIPAIVALNDGMCRMLEMTHDEVMQAYGENAHLLFTPEDIASTAKQVAQAFACCGQYDCKCRLNCKDGKYKLVMAFGRFVKDENGAVFLNSYFTDISKQVDVEEKQKLLLDNLPIGAALYRFDGERLTALHINKQYQTMVNRQSTSATTDSLPMDYIHPDDREVVFNEVTDAIANHRGGCCDVRLLYGESEYRTFHIDAQITQQPDGAYLIYAAYSRISEQEMNFKSFLPFIFSTIMESSTDLAFAKDINFRYICCSRTFAKLLGLGSEKDVVGKTDYELFSSEIADMFRRNDSALFASERPQIDITESIPSPDGLLHYTKTSKHLLRDTVGNVVGIYCVGRDVTNAREADAQLRLLTNSIPGGIATFRCTEKEYRLTYFNDGFSELFGYSKPEFIMPVSDIMGFIFEQDRAAVEERIAALVKDGTPLNCVYRVHVKDGGYRWLSHNAILADRVNNAAIVNAVFLDITQQQEEKERLQVSEELNRLAIEHSGNIITRFDVANRTLTLPNAFNPIFVLPHVLCNMPEEQIALGRVSPDTADIYRELFEGIVRGQAAGTAAYKQNSTKGWRWMEAQYTTVFSSTGRPMTAVISFSDITERLEKEVVYNKWQQSLNERPKDSYTLFRCNLSKVASFDSVEGTLLKAEFHTETGGLNERTAEYVTQCVLSEDRETYLAFLNTDTMLAAYYRGHRSDVLEYRECGKDGVIRWRRLTVDLVEYPNSKDIEAYLMFEDIDKQKRAELMTLERSEKDPLTGILNRAAFISRMEACLSEARPGAKHALMMLDIDNFKQINDTLGHAVGDHVLTDLTKKIGSILRRGDLLGRMGGDEFFVFLRNIPDQKAAAAKAEQICALKIAADCEEKNVTASIGIAIAPDDGNDFDTLYKKVDAALYSQKRQGKNGYLFVAE